MQEQHEFSEWLHAMRSQQPAAAAASHTSAASSWADTDSDSDSDSELYAAHFTTAARKSKMAPSVERTAPMLIPQASRPRRRPYYMNEFEDSAPSHLQQYHQHTAAFHESSVDAESEEDEDDPALYQNLAYFRSQNARKAPSSHHKRQQGSVRSSSPVSSTASDSDDIFDMEL